MGVCYLPRVTKLVGGRAGILFQLFKLDFKSYKTNMYL